MEIQARIAGCNAAVHIHKLLLSHEGDEIKGPNNHRSVPSNDLSSLRHPKPGDSGKKCLTREHRVVSSDASALLE